MKAALDDAIAAFARRPELASALWERLLQSVVVQPLSAEDNRIGPVARYDITYQLNEIEAYSLHVPKISLCCFANLTCFIVID